MYLVLDNQVTIYQTKGDYNVIVEKIDANKRKQFDYFTVNKTGKLLLEAINGKQNMEEFIENFIDTYNLVEDDRNWIETFLNEMMKKGAIAIKESPEIANLPLYIYGNSRLISPLHVTVEITENCNL